ncbi:MAG: 4-hydroxy-3-methylbut-2-enyl diphosphate reductase [Sphaerochaetaceae bacterium]|jgi:4-hydroxy-3-methylbut-2-enyl diphosphate reductase
MRVILSDVISYCGGVDRALRLADKCLSDAQGPVYSLGQLIHNPEVCSRLEEKGLRSIQSPEGITPGVLIIHAHGAGDGVRTVFQKAGFTLCDATCPIVRHNVEMLKQLSRAHHIVVVGERSHDEVRTMCDVGVPVAVIGTPEEVSGLSTAYSYAIFVQTTFSQKLFEAVCQAFQAGGYRFFTANNVCSSPIKRKKAILQLILKCDAVIVVGGRNSANTRMLADVVEAAGKPVWLIENAKEVTDAMRVYPVVGIASGTSTSLETIRQVREKLLDNDPEKNGG